jgi:hypothetical protein
MQSYGVWGEILICGENLREKRELEGIYQGVKGFDDDIGKIGRVKWVRGG